MRNKPLSPSSRGSVTGTPLFISLVVGLLAIGAVRAPGATVTGRVFLDRNGDGLSDPAEPGIARVVVSDGRRVVQTSETGAYEIDISPDATHVFVSLPRGYRARGNFYVSARSASPANFALEEWRESRDDHTRFVQVSDIHVTDAPETQRTFREDLEEIGALEPKPAFILATGDLVNAGDETKQFESYVAGIKNSPVPVFNLPGNHDAKIPTRLAHYCEYLGPGHYSFNFGNCHFILFNGNFYAYSNQEKLLEDFITSGRLPADPDNSAAAELAWIRQDIAAAPKGAMLVIGTHFMPTATMLRLFSSLGAKAVLSGHWHGSRVRESAGLLDINTPPMRFGGIDRQPRGFRVVEIANGQVKNELRLGGFDRHAAIVSPSGIQHLENGKVAVLVNAYDSRWTAEGVDCEIGGQRLALHQTGVWSWSGEVRLPAGISGRQTVVATIRAANGHAWKAEGTFETGAAAAPLQLKWSASTGGLIGMSSPRTGRSAVFIGVDDSGNLEHCGVMAFNFDGSKRWHFRSDSGIKNNVAVANGRVFAISVAGRLYALDEETGRLLWKADLDGRDTRWEVAAPAVADGAVYVGASSYIAAFDSVTGRRIWEDAAASNQEAAVGNLTDWWPLSYSVPVPAGGKVLLTHLRYGAAAVDAHTGHPAWTLPGTFTAFAVDGGKAYTIRDGLMTAMNPDTGAAIWTVKGKPGGVPANPLLAGDKFRAAMGSFGGNASKPVLAGDRFVTGTADGTVEAFATKDGARLWSYQTGPSLTSLEPYERGGSDVNSSPVVSDGVVYFGASDGCLYAISLADGHKIASFSLGTPIASSPVIVDRTLYIGAYDGNLYAFALGSPHNSN